MLVLLHHFPPYSQSLYEPESPLPPLGLLAPLLTSAGVTGTGSHVWLFYVGVNGYKLKSSSEHSRCSCPPIVLLLRIFAPLRKVTEAMVVEEWLCVRCSHG